VPGAEGMEQTLANPLQKLLELNEHEKETRGLKYTPREIFQQPDTWRDTFALCERRRAEIAGFLKQSGVASEQPPIVYLVGAGSSDYIGRALVALLRRCWQCEVSAVPSTNLLLGMGTRLLEGRNYLFISFSRSGDSAEGVAVLKNALEAYPQVRHLIVTCNADAAMVKICLEHEARAFALVLGATVNDRGLAMTSSFTNMLLAGQFLAHIQDAPAYGGVVHCLSKTGERLLTSASEIAFDMTERNFPAMCFVGSEALAAVADESALKVLELSAGKIHTMAQSTLGLRHGPMAAINQHTLFVQFLSNQPRVRQYEMDLLEEVTRKNLAGARLLVGSQSTRELQEMAEQVVDLDLPAEFPDDCRPPLDVIVGQLLGLFSSLRAGQQPDNPSPNGIISRVVAGIRIHS